MPASPMGFPRTAHRVSGAFFSPFSHRFSHRVHHIHRVRPSRIRPLEALIMTATLQSFDSPTQVADDIVRRLNARGFDVWRYDGAAAIYLKPDDGALGTAAGHLYARSQNARSFAWPTRRQAFSKRL